MSILDEKERKEREDGWSDTWITTDDLLAKIEALRKENQILSKTPSYPPIIDVAMFIKDDYNSKIKNKECKVFHDVLEVSPIPGEMYRLAPHFIDEMLLQNDHNVYYARWHAEQNGETMAGVSYSISEDACLRVIWEIKE